MLGNLGSTGMGRGSFFRAMKLKPTKRSRQHRPFMPVLEEEGKQEENLSKVTLELGCVFCLVQPALLRPQAQA